jgi:hypothetical protein
MSSLSEYPVCVNVKFDGESIRFIDTRSESEKAVEVML